MQLRLLGALAIGAAVIWCGPTATNAQDGGLKFRAERHGPSRAALVLCNCDASDMPADGGDHTDRFTRDNFDGEINGSADEKQVEPIWLVRTRTEKPVTLRFAHYRSGEEAQTLSKMRVFRADGKEILGPRTRSEYSLTASELANLAKEDLKLYAEALNFGVTVRLQVFEGNDQRDELVLHAAPLLLLSDCEQPVKNFVVNLGTTASSIYVQAFKAACEGTAKVPVRELHSGDQWIQDEMQWAYTYTSRAGFPVALHVPRDRELRASIPTLLAPEIGYFKPFTFPRFEGSSLDYGGNIEVTPRSDRNPFGRVYFGHRAAQALLQPHRAVQPSMSEALQDFFKSQKADPADDAAIQNPIELATDWLAVGHVDEIVAFVPANNARKFMLLHASPRKALEILDGMRPNTALHEYYQKDYLVRTIQELIDTPSTTEIGLLGETLEIFNRRVQRIIDNNVAILKSELGLADADVIELPVLFRNFQNYSEWSAEALTPGLGNLSAMNQICLLPDPFIPEFRDYTTEQLAKIGQQALFIDDWDIYHSGMGEVHCGSNMLRKPISDPWWTTGYRGQP